MEMHGTYYQTKRKRALNARVLTLFKTMEYMLKLLRKLFLGQDQVSAKQVFQFTDDQMEGIKKENRSSLALIDDWIDEAAFNKSFFKYGVPDFIKTEINKPIGETITYTDLMLFISRKYFTSIHYFEIGVSVGKNFFQLINAHAKGSFTGFDIEEINPVLEKRLVFKSCEDLETT